MLVDERRLPSGNRLRKVGKAFAVGHESDDDILDWETYSYHCDILQRQAVDLLRASLEGYFTIDGVPIKVIGRSKTRTSLLEKLRRERHLALPSIQDCAGVRIVGNISLQQQDQLGEAFEEILSLDSEPRLLDHRKAPFNGYRALHVIIRTGRVPVEIQIRTTLQNKWANIFELYSDIHGREMRYRPSGKVEVREVRNLVHTMEEKSVEIAKAEELVLDDLALALYNRPRLSSLSKETDNPEHQEMILELLKLQDDLKKAGLIILRYQSQWLDTTESELSGTKAEIEHVRRFESLLEKMKEDTRARRGLPEMFDFGGNQ